MSPAPVISCFSAAVFVVSLCQDTSHLPPRPYVIGLTGGSGSGKSSVAKQLEALGAVEIDCDKLGHEVYQLGTEAYHKVLQEFGSGMIISVIFSIPTD